MSITHVKLPLCGTSSEGGPYILRKKLQTNKTNGNYVKLHEITPNRTKIGSTPYQNALKHIKT